MWLEFFLSVACVAAFLFVPGYCCIRAFGVRRPYALAAAPLVSVLETVLLGMVYESVGIASSFATHFAVLALFGAACLVLGRLVRRGKPSVGFGLSGEPLATVGSFRLTDGACLGLYLLFGVAFCGAVFVWYLGDPASYSQQYDNISHLGSIRSFVESGVWSPFHSSLYSTDADVAITPLPSSPSFYPTAWYSVAAAAMSATGIASGMAENVTNFAFVGLVLPSSSFFLMRVVFDGRPSVVPFGAFCALLFSAFPWMLLNFGPLYPNLSAFCLVPASVACFVLLLRKGLPKGQRALVGALFALSLAALAFSQPNAVFTVAVLVSAYLVVRVSDLAELLPASRAVKLLCRIALAVAAVVLIAGIWKMLNSASFMRSVVEHSWPVTNTRAAALVNVLTMGLESDGGGQIVLSIAVLAGIVCAIIHREYAWMIASFLFAAAIYMVDSASDGPLQHLLGGFWYTDMWRCAAMAALAALPLAVLGVWAVARLVVRIFERVRSTTASASCRLAVALITCVVVVVGSTFPGVPFFDGKGNQGAVAFRSVVSTMSDSVDMAVYDDDEKMFVQEVEQVIPADALVINVPDDGSAFAYVADGLRTYYRYTRYYDVPSETDDSKAIRDNLCDIASDDDVKEAVRNIGAKYVLQLDQGEPGVPRPYLFTYENGEKWHGIDAIRDDTPGFEVVLAEGDMRLYKITAAD